jgi:hypothetical protein
MEAAVSTDRYISSCGTRIYAVVHTDGSVFLSIEDNSDKLCCAFLPLFQRLLCTCGFRGGSCREIYIEIDRRSVCRLSFVSPCRMCPNFPYRNPAISYG